MYIRISADSKAISMSKKKVLSQTYSITSTNIVAHSLHIPYEYMRHDFNTSELQIFPVDSNKLS